MAYTSNESGRYEVYVQSFPIGNGKWQVSTNGGIQPRWRRDGRELFYLGLDRKLMVASIRGETSLEVGTPTMLFQANTSQGANIGTGLSQQYDVTSDGQRFLMNVPAGGESAAPITVVLNWTAGVKK